MSQIPAPQPQTYPYPPPARRSWMGCAFALSVLLNLAAGGLFLVLLVLVYFATTANADAVVPLTEKFVSGSKSATDKVAIITVDGVIMEGLLSHAHKQIEQAARDATVKAIVLRVNSPGGSITASDDLYRKIVALRDGDADQSFPAKPIVASFGSVAASGGYFIAAPAQRIVAERSTMTGSIGVYASFPNVEKLAKTSGVSMNTIKAGEIKNTGSMFEPMTDKQQQVIQDMVDDAYNQFLEIVEKGRPRLKRAKLLDRFTVTPIVPDPKMPRDEKLKEPYTRYIADGGIFTAIEAKRLDLVDDVGPLDVAVKAAAKLGSLTSYRAISYPKHKSLTELILGANSNASPAGSILDAGRLQSMATPRLWYLAPGYELAGRLATQP